MDDRVEVTLHEAVGGLDGHLGRDAHPTANRVGNGEKRQERDAYRTGAEAVPSPCDVVLGLTQFCTGGKTHLIDHLIEQPFYSRRFGADQAGPSSPNPDRAALTLALALALALTLSLL